MNDKTLEAIRALPEKLLKEIRKGEGVSVELKESKRELPGSLFESVTAMLNRNGGHIFLGVSNDGTIIGVNEDSVQELKCAFANLCNNPQKIYPTVHLDIEDYGYGGHTILHIYVFEGSDVYKTAGKIFDRNEDGDFEITNSTQLIAQLYIRKSSTYTENKVYPFATMDDLRPDLISRARRLASIRRPGHPWGEMGDMDLLKSIGLYERNLQTGDEGLNLAGILLFGKDETIRSALSHYRTDAIFRIEDENRYDDRDDIRTNLIDATDRLVAFIRKHTDDKFYLENNQRISLMDVIARELCVNMVIHREYANPLPARLVVTSQEIIAENANKPRTIGFIDLDGYNPYPKNPKIAAFFKEIGYAEELGSGIRKITKYTAEYSGGVPLFEDDSKFRAIIPLVSQTAEESNLNNAVYAFIAKKGRTSRKEINAEFYPKMRGLSEEQRNVKIHNVLTTLRRRIMIENKGSRTEPVWQIV